MSDTNMQDPLGLMQMGLDPDFQANDAYFKAAIHERFDSIVNTAKTFGTPEGKKELARLVKATVNSPAWSPSLAQSAGLDAANAHAYAREGQNALVREIEERLELALKVKSPEDLYDLLRGAKENG